MGRDPHELIDESFTNHTPVEGSIEKIEELRKLAKEFAHKAEDLCPPSREKSLGFTHVETALMYYVKSVVLPR